MFTYQTSMVLSATDFLKPSRQKSAHISKAIIFYYENGPSNLEGLWQKVHTRERYIRELERDMKALKGEFTRDE